MFWLRNKKKIKKKISYALLSEGMAVERFSVTFQGRFNFQGLFKKAFLIKVLFQACVNNLLELTGSFEAERYGRGLLPIFPAECLFLGDRL